MTESFRSESGVVTPKGRFQYLLIILGIPAIILTSVLAARLIWEETFLTYRQGPQMIGVSLAHGDWALLLLAPLLLLIWLITVAIAMTAFYLRKSKISTSLRNCFASGLLLLGLISIPQVFWQWAFSGSFAKSPHAPDLMTYAAATGDTRTMKGYIAHGVPVESRDYEGSTAAFRAAGGDNLPALAFLASKGSDLNAVNAYGDSPLEAAVKNRHEKVVTFLRQHGALRIRGTEEQRQAATRAIVMRQIERQHSNNGLPLP